MINEGCLLIWFQLVLEFASRNKQVSKLVFYAQSISAVAEDVHLFISCCTTSCWNPVRINYYPSSFFHLRAGPHWV